MKLKSRYFSRKDTFFRQNEFTPAGRLENTFSPRKMFLGKDQQFDILTAFAQKGVLTGFLLLIMLCTANIGFGQDILPSSQAMDELNTVAQADTSLHPAIKKGSIIPVPIIVTEPALGGIGGGLAVGYLHSNRKSLRKNTPPTITGIAGAYTANRSWAVGIAHSHSWDNDKIRYYGELIKANVNVDFYEKIFTTNFAINVNLDIWATYHRVLFRLGNSKFFIGPQYLYLHTDNRLNEDTDHPRLDSLLNTIEIKSNLGMLGVDVLYDSRDNTLSPNTGLFVGFKAFYNSPIFGGNKYTILGIDIKENFFMGDAKLVYYFPVGKRVFGGVRFNAQFVEGKNIPFYAKPYIHLRGVPGMRYQGNEVFALQTQWRGMVYKNLSILGFVGTAKAMDKLSEFGAAEWIYNYGGGFRYGLSRAFGVRLGIDVAWSNDDFAWYISVGKSF